MFTEGPFPVKMKIQFYSVIRHKAAARTKRTERETDKKKHFKMRHHKINAIKCFEGFFVYKYTVKAIE